MSIIKYEKSIGEFLIDSRVLELLKQKLAKYTKLCNKCTLRGMFTTFIHPKVIENESGL